MIENLLSRLDGVKQTSHHKWIVRCPAHEDRSPSLSITETPDKVLVHCHAGCSADDIVAAVGLELKDLFPASNLTPQQKHQYQKQKSRAETEAAFYHELLVLVQVVGARVTDREAARYFRETQPGWGPMPDETWDRESLAVSRIRAGMEKLYG